MELDYKHWYNIAKRVKHLEMNFGLIVLISTGIFFEKTIDHTEKDDNNLEKM